MVYVTNIEIVLPGELGEGFTQSEALTNSTNFNKRRTFNQSIGLLLRSYTRAINKQEKVSGSLFRKKTKADCLNSPQMTPAFINTSSGTFVNVPCPGKEYPQLCFDYIHHNPLASNLVKDISDWEFSSAKDYYSNRKGTLVNKERALDFGINWC
jgi:putative transposase